MKKLLCIILILLFSLLNIQNVNAIDSINLDEIYKEQYEISGAKDLMDKIPNDAQNTLDNLGIEVDDWNTLMNLTPNKIFSELMETVRKQLPSPLQAGLSILAVMLLCALLEGMKLSFGERPLSGVVGAISTLCISITVILQIVKTIEHTATVVRNSADFMLVYIPVMAGIMIASGQTVSAISYHMMMVFAGDIISQIAAKLLVPLLNIFLAFSVVSSISPRMNLSGICKNISSIVKWTLGFVMSVFVSLLTVQSVVGCSADDMGLKTIKFAISSFVPVVGGALSDAFSTVRGCVKLLKSGVGAFGILAGLVIFLPVIVKCLLWMLSLGLCASVGDVFELKQISELLRSVSRVVSTMLAIVLCSMTILTISTVLVLIIGGGVN